METVLTRDALDVFSARERFERFEHQQLEQPLGLQGQLHCSPSLRRIASCDEALQV